LDGVREWGRRDAAARGLGKYNSGIYIGPATMWLVYWSYVKLRVHLFPLHLLLVWCLFVDYTVHLLTWLCAAPPTGHLNAHADTRAIHAVAFALPVASCLFLGLWDVMLRDYKLFSDQSSQDQILIKTNLFHS
jgi:hypothetical protein